MNILPARCVFFFSPLLCPTYLPPPIPPPTSPVLPTTYLPPPTLNLPPLPTYHLRTPPLPHSIARARLVEWKLELWSYCCGAVELEQELERPPDPHPHDQVKCLFFILFLFVLFEEASKLQAPELLGFGACLLQLNPTTQQAPERESLLTATQQAPKHESLLAATQQAPKHESLLRCNSKLQSVKACCCNAANSGACPALELACCNAVSFGAFRLRSVRALQQQAPELVRLRSLLAAMQ
jgi:hypothetical protein